MVELQPRDDDSEILGITEQICTQLNLGKSYPRKILWKNYQSALGYATPTPDHPTWDGNTLILSKALKGKLQPEEWRPLITSSIIFGKKLREKLAIQLILSTVLILILAFTIVILSLTLVASPSLLLQIVGAIATIGDIAFTLFLGTLIGSVSRWRVMLEADRRTVNLINANSFLQTLQKINNLNLEDVERSNKGGLRAHYTYNTPSLSARIRTLKNYP